MAAVGVRELKNRLSRYIKRVKAGERLIVTERGEPVAVISPAPQSRVDRSVETLIREGAARWGGGKPRGAAHPRRIRGPSVAAAVIEGRG